MDAIKLQKALGMLQAIVDEIPGHGVAIKDTYVNLYHQTLTTIQSELQCDLSEFFVRSSELHRLVTSIPFGFSVPRGPRPETTYSEESYCESERFMIVLKGAINTIKRLLADDPPKRIVGFSK
jgi:hypothetical protein